MHASGDVLDWINSDDMLSPWSLGIVGEIFQQLRSEVHRVSRIPSDWDEKGRRVMTAPPRRYDGSLIRLGAYANRILGFIQQGGAFWSRAPWERAGGHLDTAVGIAGDLELRMRFSMHAPLHAAHSALRGARRWPGQITATRIDEYVSDVRALRRRDLRVWTAGLTSTGVGRALLRCLGRRQFAWGSGPGVRLRRAGMVLLPWTEAGRPHVARVEARWAWGSPAATSFGVVRKPKPRPTVEPGGYSKWRRESQ